MHRSVKRILSLSAAAFLISLLPPQQAGASWYLPRNPDQKPPGAEQPQPRPQPTPPAENVDLTAQEQELLKLTNQARLEAGLNALKPDPTLMRLARLKAQDIVDKGYFSHNSPTYGSPYEMEKAAGIKARIMGAENLAKARDVRRAHAQFMASQGHRDNILYKGLTHIGIGVVQTRTGVVVCELFIGR